jgi:hypothetical protein
LGRERALLKLKRGKKNEGRDVGKLNEDEKCK